MVDTIGNNEAQRYSTQMGHNSGPKMYILFPMNPYFECELTYLARNTEMVEMTM